MAFCGNCGTQAEGVKFCPNCGAPTKPAGFVGRGGTTEQANFSPQGENEQAQFVTTSGQPMGAAVQQPQPAQQPGPVAPVQAQRQMYQAPVVPGAPHQAEIRDAQDNKTMAILAYILFFIPLLTGAHKTSAFARYHTNQGTVLFIAAAIYGIAYGILTAVLLFIPVIGWILIMVLGLASIFFLALCIAGIINAANGRMRPLPVIGRITVIK